MNRVFKISYRGFTLVEILMVIGIILIVVSFAIPSVSGANNRAELRAAVENLEYSIRIARNTARTEESTISMNLLDTQDGSYQRITFSSPELAGSYLGKNGIQEYQFSREILFDSDYPSYEFDARGIVKKPGVITLASRSDESITMQLTVE